MKKTTRLEEAMLETAKEMWDSGIANEEDYSRILARHAYFRKRPNYWVASCPSLDVVSRGPTKEEAEKNLEEALRLFLHHERAHGKADL
jgi:hypothetical protein